MHSRMADFAGHYAVEYMSSSCRSLARPKSVSNQNLSMGRTYLVGFAQLSNIEAEHHLGR
jgi:hypothetical protein